MRESHACQNHVAELSRGGLDHWRVVVADKHRGSEEGGEEAEAGKGDRDHGLGVCPFDKLHGYLVAHWNQLYR